jgi:HTH-type transcriptional regulator/antitoxin HipB
MIKNSKQASITKEKLEELKKAREEFEADEKNKEDPLKYELGINSFNGLIQDLENQLQQYNSLVEGNFHCLQPKSMQDIPNVLIAARLAQKMSQKDLAELVNLKEQQIQRYEATDYQTASWVRIVEVSSALKIQIHFEKTIIIETDEEEGDDAHNYPPGITKTQVEEATSMIKNNRSLILA